MSEYAYDVFVSYRNRAEVGEWVARVLVPHLRAALSDDGAEEPRIFLDRLDLAPGERWPDALKEALRRSRCMVAVLEPQYFRSGWCLSEFYSFHARQPGLIIPVRYSDGDHFDDEAKALQHVDFGEHVGRSYAAARGNMAFRALRRTLAQRILESAASAPAWSPDFPLVRHDDRRANAPFRGMHL